MTSPSVIVIGNFDGVHRGHQAVLHQARALADSRGLECVVLTFDPHPSEVLGRGAPPLLTSIERRVELLRESGASRVVVQPFTLEFAALAPHAFAEELLVKRLSARAVVVGENFRFGHKRAGDFATLVELGGKLGFEAIAAEVAGDSEGPFSSTRVRDAISRGDVTAAAVVLGRPHELRGVVERGDARGRTIGFPTANLGGVREMLPAFGVYAVRVAGDEGDVKDGVMNVGVRPTIDGSALRIEAHLFDFEGDLYGRKLTARLVQRIREEKKFDSLDALKAQIARDAADARKILTG